MAYFRGTWHSQALDMKTSIALCIPDMPAQPKATVVLLHGLKGNADDWMIHAGVAYYARQYNIAFVMPEVQRSWYTDMAYGLDYFGYVANELPQLLENFFHLPTDRDHYYIGGLSMGGFGALHCALTYPEKYAGCMSFSARVYLKNKTQQLTAERHYREMEAILGQGMPILPENDTTLLLEKASRAPLKPKLYVSCGTGDPLYPESVQLKGELKQHDFDLTYEEWAGIHNWTFWREALPRALDTMGLTK